MCLYFCQKCGSPIVILESEGDEEARIQEFKRLWRKAIQNQTPAKIRARLREALKQYDNEVPLEKKGTDKNN